MNNMLEIENLCVNYGNTPALQNVDLVVEEGEFLGIMGPNGGGKSTLLKAMLGLIKPSEGTIRFTTGADGKQKRIGYVPQFAVIDRRFPITVKEVVLSGHISPGLHPFFKYSKEDERDTIMQLERVGMADLADRHIMALSGGEFQKMLIARALAVQPELLLLDEPTASVDAMSREQIYRLLGELNREITIIMVTHDMMAVSSNINKLACLNEKLVYHGEPELNESVVNKLYGCPVELVAHGVPHRVLKEHEGGHCEC